MASSAPVHVFSGVVHPEREAIFREDAPPRSIIKEGRKDAVLGCTNCGKLGDEQTNVKKCAGCKLAYYCSQECQRQNWATHKPNCSSELGEGIQPLIKSVTGNPMISHYIQVCLSLKFSLHRLQDLPAHKRRAFLRQPRSVHIDVGIEPTMIADFMNLYTYPEDWDKDDMDGMLQFHHLSTADDWAPPRTLTPKDIAIWNRARADTDADGEPENAVFLVQFVNNFRQMITCVFDVGEDALGQARRGLPFTMGSAITGKETDVPLSVASCFEYLNTHIRADKKNRLLLRAPMRPSDKELIRDAGRQKDGHAPRMLRLKMSREGVYVSHPIDIVRGAAASREDAFGRPRPEDFNNVLPEERQIAFAATDPREAENGQEQGEPDALTRAERRRKHKNKRKKAKDRK